jgi:hypothetical protein
MVSQEIFEEQAYIELVLNRTKSQESRAKIKKWRR